MQEYFLLLEIVILQEYFPSLDIVILQLSIFHSWILLFCNNGEGSASALRLLRPPHWFAFFSKNDPRGDGPAGDGDDDGEFDDGVGNSGDDGRDFYLLFVYRSLQWRWSEIRWFFA